jgi:hypothetical protein
MTLMDSLDLSGIPPEVMLFKVRTGRCPECGEEHTLEVKGNLDRLPVVQCPKTRGLIRIPPPLVGSQALFVRSRKEEQTPSYWSRVV